MDDEKDNVTEILSTIIIIIRYLFFWVAYLLLVYNVLLSITNYSLLIFTIFMYVGAISVNLVEIDSQYIKLFPKKRAKKFRRWVLYSFYYSLALLVLVFFQTLLSPLMKYHILLIVFKVTLLLFTVPVFVTNLWSLTIKDVNSEQEQNGIKHVNKMAEEQLIKVLENRENEKLDTEQIKRKSYRDFTKKMSHNNRKE